MNGAASKELEANRTLRLLAAKRRSPGMGGAVDARCTGGQMLVDIGCSTGAFLGRMHDRYDALVGIDFIPAARSEFDNVQFLQADLRLGIPLAEAMADTVTATEVIEHIADPILLVREAFRIARPGAAFILTTPNIRYIKHLFQLVVRGRGPKTAAHHDDELLWDGSHVHYFTSSDLEALLKEAGFVGVRSRADSAGGLSTARPRPAVAVAGESAGARVSDGTAAGHGKEAGGRRAGVRRWEHGRHL